MPSITRRRAARAGRPTSAEADILAATQRLLIGGASFTEIGVQQISAEAGVARSSFYNHFRDKTDLLVRLAAGLMATSFDMVSPWRPTDGVESLVDTFLRVLQVYREHAAVRRAITEVAAYDETVRTFFRKEIDQFTDQTIAVLRAEQAAGRTPAGIDPVSATRLIVMGGEQALADHVNSEAPATDAALARELALTWWHGIYRRPMSQDG